MIEEKITVTKIDAARRQLRAAIILWFDEGDPVATHTILAAAHEILHRIYRNRGFSDLIFDSLIVKDEYRSEWNKLLKSHANFFKHSAHDMDGTIEAPPVASGQSIYCAREPTELKENSSARFTDPRRFGCSALSVSASIPTKSASFHSWV